MYKVFGRFGIGSWEIIDEADTYEEAESMLYEYQIAFGKGWEMYVD